MDAPLLVNTVAKYSAGYRHALGDPLALSDGCLEDPHISRVNQLAGFVEYGCRWLFRYVAFCQVAA